MFRELGRMASLPMSFPTLKRKRRRRLPPGSAPGQILVDPTAQKTVVKTMRYGPEFLEERTIKSLEELRAEKEREGVLWVQIEGHADEAFLRGIQDIFQLHRLAMEDVVNTDQRAKVDDYKQSLFVVLHQTGPEEGHAEQISFFLAGNAVISIQETTNEFLKPIGDRLRGVAPIFRSSGPAYLLYALVDIVVDGYYGLIDRFGTRIEHLEVEILHAKRRDPAATVHLIKQELLELRKLIWQARDAINSLREDYPASIPPEVSIYLRDSYDHLVEQLDRVELYRENAANLMDLHYNNMSHRTNEVMKVITIVGAIFIPLNFIAALYGMNFDPEISVWNMPELGWRYGYLYALGLMAVTASGMVIFFYYKGWIGKRRRRR